MDTIFINFKNSKKSDPRSLLLNLTDKIKLKRNDKYVALSNLSIYYTWKNIKESYKNNKIKILALTWNDEFELPDVSYSVSDVQDYFEYTLKKQGDKTDNPSIRTCVNKMENIITFRIKAGYYLVLLKPETMKLFGSTKSKISKDENGENIPYLEITEVVSVHCKYYQQRLSTRFKRFVYTCS